MPYNIREMQTIKLAKEDMKTSEASSFHEELLGSLKNIGLKYSTWLAICTFAAYDCMPYLQANNTLTALVLVI